MWKELLKLYEENQCLVDESEWPRTETEIAKSPYAWSKQFPKISQGGSVCYSAYGFI